MRTLPLILAAMFLAGTASSSHAADHAKKRTAPVEERTVAHRRADRAYLTRNDARIIREYYEPRYRQLPPGLQKKLQRTGTLPPGWQKKLQAFPRTVERQLSPLPSSYRRGFYDGYAVIYDPHTRRILDVDGPYWR